MSAMTYLEGIDKFNSLRLRGDLEQLWARVTHHCQCLLSVEELNGGKSVRQRRDAGIRFVPIDRIVGSVGRRHDFTRSFLPLAGANAGRWAQIYEAINSAHGVPEIELLKIGEAYVVEDGHHRISAGRAAGLDQIAAHVVEVLG